MKPFDLERFKAGDIAVSRDGKREYRYVGTLSRGMYPLVCERIDQSAASHDTAYRTLDGANIPKAPDNLDLFMKSKKEVRFLLQIIGRTGVEQYISFGDRNVAEGAMFRYGREHPNTIHRIIPIEWEE